MGNRKNNSVGGFTLIELMVVILIVAILAAIAIPILRGRINEAKWSEGKAMVGSIASPIRAYHEQAGPDGSPPTTLSPGPTASGFAAGDLTGTYFSDADFSFNVISMNRLAFAVTANNAGLDPASYQLDQSGNWIP
jgi:prepilin-type N-terminal cleavage/methylation domain-containing protein